MGAGYTCSRLRRKVRTRIPECGLAHGKWTCARLTRLGFGVLGDYLIPLKYCSLHFHLHYPNKPLFGPAGSSFVVALPLNSVP